MTVNGALAGAYLELQLGILGLITRAGGGTGGGKSGGGSFSGGRSGGISSGYRSGGSSGASSYRGTGAAGVGGVLGLILGIACLLVVVLVVVALARAAKRSGRSLAGLPADAAAAGAPRAVTTQLGHDPHAGEITTRAGIDEAIARLREHDPGFNESDFLSDCNRAFFTIQQAWTERRPEISRQVMHDGIWQQHRFQIDQYLSQGKQNVLENLAVQNSRVVSVSADQSFETIMVRFFASCADYDMELGPDGRPTKVVRGDREVRDWAEDWIFQRKASATTKPDGGTMAKRCPNCGAPLDLDLAGVCRYCRAPVMSGEFDWVLTRIEQLPSYEYAQSTLPT